MNHHRRADESGASAVEYALIMTLIAMAVVLSVAFFGTTTAGLFDPCKPCDAVVDAGSKATC